VAVVLSNRWKTRGVKENKFVEELDAVYKEEAAGTTLHMHDKDLRLRTAFPVVQLNLSPMLMFWAYVFLNITENENTHICSEFLFHVKHEI
jgi:hypothetical protein